MKILKIFGVVVAVHAAVFMFVFAIPGCRTSSRPAPQAPAADTGAPSPTVSYPGAPSASSDASPSMSGTDVNPATSDAPPSVSFNAQHYNPTRPGTAAAGVLQTDEVGGVTPATTYKVQANDSLWKIGKKFGIGSEDLAKANNLKQGASLKVGQKLIIPGKPAKAGSGNSPAGTRTYTVKAGDSLSSIAHKNSTTTADIRSLNPQIKNDSVRAGQELTLPASGKSAAAAATAAVEPVAPAASGAPVAAPAGSIVYTVKPGEGVGQIAKKFGVPQKEILLANNMADPKNLRAGQKLIIPGVKTPGTTAPSLVPSVLPPVDQGPVSPVAPVSPSENPVAPAPDAGPVSAPASSDAPPPPVVKVEDSAPVSPAK